MTTNRRGSLRVLLNLRFEMLCDSVTTSVSFVELCYSFAVWLLVSRT